MNMWTCEHVSLCLTRKFTNTIKRRQRKATWEIPHRRRANQWQWMFCKFSFSCVGCEGTLQPKAPRQCLMLKFEKHQWVGKTEIKTYAWGNKIQQLIGPFETLGSMMNWVLWMKYLVQEIMHCAVWCFGYLGWHIWYWSWLFGCICYFRWCIWYVWYHILYFWGRTWYCDAHTFHKFCINLRQGWSEAEQIR